jgi:putative colanic acid biosynthesis UDP-glucose lipid carrier transferase
MKNGALKFMVETTLKARIEPTYEPDLFCVNPQPPAVVVPASSPLYKKRNRLFKRCLDLAFATACLPPLLVMISFIALLVKFDSKGPVFFFQKRNKRNGKIFTCIKIRTMTVAGDERRITALGQFLRKYHLDELPQLINVWWGDMSLIGPRPHMISDNQIFAGVVKNYHTRHTVKPGITGLAQILGHVGPVVEANDIIDRVSSDLQYIRQWSPMLDIRIIGHSFLRLTGMQKLVSPQPSRRDLQVNSNT